jgi:hypothetical protein
MSRIRPPSSTVLTGLDIEHGKIRGWAICATGSFCRAEELLSRGVAHACLLREVAGFAARWRRDPTLGLRPANVSGGG